MHVVVYYTLPLCKSEYFDVKGASHSYHYYVLSSCYITEDRALMSFISYQIPVKWSPFYTGGMRKQEVNIAN